MVHKSYSSGFGSFPNKVNNEKEIDIDNELEKNYEKFYDWLKTCPFKWTESSHPTSGMTCVNFDLIKDN